MISPQIEWIARHASYGGDDCLVWPFSYFNHGYGLVKHDGKHKLAHRIMCMEAHGQPTEDKPNALHSCGNGHLGCVNPRHLRWGNQSENREDMRGHKTLPMGETNGAARLRTADVLSIRQRIAEGATQRAVAKEFGVGVATVCNIANRKAWAHVA